VIYIHAIYYSIVTVSHIGVGDITAITVPERLINCVIVLIGTFSYAILFGNIASLVSDFASDVRSALQDKYHASIVHLQKNNLTARFGR
jgi:hypothetical protein